MGGLFNPEGEFVQYGAKLWDMIWLNVLVAVCSLPLFTTGAALNAMHYVLLKIFRDEESGITALFFHAFRENFKQSTILSLIFGGVVYLFVTGIAIAFRMQMGALRYLLIAVFAVLICMMNWSLILQSRYRNSAVRTVQYGFFMVFAHPFRSVAMTALAILPVAAIAVAVENLILVVLCGFTLPGFVQVFFYNRIFQKLEADSQNSEQNEKTNGGEEI